MRQLFVCKDVSSYNVVCSIVFYVYTRLTSLVKYLCTAEINYVLESHSKPMHA